MSNQYTVEQVKANFKAAQKRLEPAVLRDSTPEDRAFIERLVTLHMVANQLEPTADNFYSSFELNYKLLPWSVPPAKLLADKNAKMAAPASKDSTWKDSVAASDARTQNQKAVDAAAAKKAADDASIKQAKALIEAYLPTINRGAASRYDNQEREKMQTKWTEALNAEIANGGDLQTFVKALAIVIEKRYRARETAQERM
jgi:hypothetical protein